MFTTIIWVIIRSVIIPYLAFLLLRDANIFGWEPGEKGALLVIGIALAIVTALSLIWNFIKIVGNTLLLRGNAVLVLIFKVVLQLVALGLIWANYLGLIDIFGVVEAATKK